MNLKSSASIPLFVGIVGHRDIAEEDKPHLKSLIIQVLNERIARCPHTQVTLLTPLAEGADRLAAYAALECGIPYIAILPMPLPDYRKEFKSDQSLMEFNELFDKAHFHYEIPTHLTPKISHSNRERDNLFYNLGVFMAGMSHLLIALWDGEVNNKTGGTSNTVDMKINGSPVIHPYYKSRLRNMHSGPVCHILTPRKGQVIANAFSIKMYYGNNSNANKEDYKFIRNIDSFNNDLENYQRKKGKNSAVTPTIFEYQEITDGLARQNQSRRFRALRLLLILAVIAFIFFQVYVEFWDKPLLLLMYPITIGLGVIWYIRATRLRFEQKHEDYRALSEAFRVQHYLSLVDKNANVSDFYLQKHEGELEWVTYVLRVIHFMNFRNSHADEISRIKKKAYQYIKDNWIKEQADYYRFKGEEYDRILRNIKLIANGLFIGAILAAVILFLISVIATDHADSHSGVMHSLLILFTHTFLVTSATLFGYNEKMIFEEQSKTYHQMFRLFNFADDKLGKAIEDNNFKEAFEIIRELGYESLMEKADWLMLHRARPMEIPKG